MPDTKSDDYCPIGFDELSTTIRLKYYRSNEKICCFLNLVEENLDIKYKALFNPRHCLTARAQLRDTKIITEIINYIVC